MSLDDQTIHWAYRLFLDREPEDQAAIDCRKGMFRSSHELRSHFISSAEFVENNPNLGVSQYIGQKPPLDIEVKVGDQELETLFKRVESSWQSLGSSEPHWSVLSADRFKTDNISETIDEFYQSAAFEADLIDRTFERNGVRLDQLNTCTEIGCGVGRITYWLARKFNIVNAFDVSIEHLKLAHEYHTLHGIENSRFQHFASLDQIENLPKSDFLYSLIVLQHNPPL